MNIGLIYSFLLFSFGAAAFYMGISAGRRRFRAHKANVILSILCFASCVWSYGFGFIFLTDQPIVAYWGRTIGMIGVFVFLILVQILVGMLGDVPKKLYHLYSSLACLGLVIYFPVVAPSQTTYYMGTYGMSYSFHPGLVSNLYSLYSILYAVNVGISIIISVRRAKNRRIKVVSYRMLATFGLVFIGMILDTILPSFGFGAIPGSTVFQFIGLMVIYYAVVAMNQTYLTHMNMSAYVYSFVMEPVMVFDTEGRLQLVNEAAETVFAEIFREVKWQGAQIEDIFEVEPDFLSFEGDHRADFAQTCRVPIPVGLQTNRIRDRYGDSIGFILTVRDMTEIRQAMESLAEAKRLAEASNVAKSVFLANMSHEIRTPLNAIVGYSELMLKDNLNPESREQAEDIRNSSQNLLAIINDILDISKIESGKMELNNRDYSIQEVLKDACMITKTLADKKNLDFNVEIDESIPVKLFGDPIRVRGVLVNVLNNAVKYTRVGFVSLKGEPVEIDGDTAILRFLVSDSGIGIRQEDIGKLFDSFSQVDAKKNAGIEGTGLGLAIVRGFLNLMGGDVRVESEYGKGTTFILTFRQRIVDATPIGKFNMFGNNAEGKSAIGEVKFPGVRVLLVDDNRMNLKVIHKILSKYEMTVTEADCGVDAIEYCRKNEYDIVLMDQMMPEMDGVEAMQAIRALGGRFAAMGGCPIVALTANAITGVREELMAVGFDGYLCKPIEFARMEELFSGYFL